MNIGMGEDLTIKKLAEAVVGYKGEIVFDISKPDGTPNKLMDARRLQSLGWKVSVSLSQGLRQAYLDYLDQRTQA